MKKVIENRLRALIAKCEELRQANHKLSGDLKFQERLRVDVANESLMKDGQIDRLKAELVEARTQIETLQPKKKGRASKKPAQQSIKESVK